MERLACKVPFTPRGTYISGIHALNVHDSSDETSGDWHGHIFYWNHGVENERVITLAGEGQLMNTNRIYGDWGIYDGKERLLRKGLEGIQPT